MLGFIIGLLGRRDFPTDAVEGYCSRLKRSLAELGWTLHLRRVDWPEIGWCRAMLRLWRESRNWQGEWVLVQYTALAWSQRGFPAGFLAVLEALKRRGARVGIVVHDPTPFEGSRFRDAARRAVQRAVLRRAVRVADRVVTTVPPEQVPWFEGAVLARKVTHIPVGSNLPTRFEGAVNGGQGTSTVVVFGVTEAKREEAALIAAVIQRVREAVDPLRLIVLGRGARQAESLLRRRLEGSGVRLEVHGVLPEEQVSDVLAEAHVQLFVRAGISTRRGSAIAGICCGLPVVGFAGAETGFPMTEAGVQLVSRCDGEELARELIAILKDEGLRNSLSQRSREAAKRYFSWDVIAEQFMEALSLGGRE